TPHAEAAGQKAECEQRSRGETQAARCGGCARAMKVHVCGDQHKKEHGLVQKEQEHAKRRARFHPAPPLTAQSGDSGCLRSQSGRRLRTIGTVSKFSAAGGEAAAHSSVQASQGSLPARAPKTKLAR